MKKTNLTTLVRNIFLTFPLYSAAFIGCGEEVTEVTNVTNEITGMEQVKKYSDLPKCSSDNFGLIYYVSDSAKVFYCNEKKWLTLNGSNGKDGSDGKDGKNGTNGKDGVSPVLFDSAGNYIPGNGDSITVVIKNYGKTVTGLGECTSKREGEVAHLDSVDNPLYYICKSKSWKTATPLEYDTYKWADTTDGASKLGKVTKKMYVFDKTKWRAAIGAEIELGLCIEKRTGEVSKYYEVYFTCNNRQWSPSTLLEYDTYGKDCLENGSIDSGKIFPYNKYVCDRGMFRFAMPMELAIKQGCSSYNKGEKVRYQYSNYVCDPDSSIAWNVYYNTDLWFADRDSSGWSFDFDHINMGTMKDPRDGKVYKTVGLKSQMWMAENLKYELKGSYCYHDSLKYCDKYGVYYKESSISKACPEGWHVPTAIEWGVLFSLPITQNPDGLRIDGEYKFNYDATGPCRSESTYNGHTTVNWYDYDCADGYWTSSKGGDYYLVTSISSGYGYYEYTTTTVYDNNEVRQIRCIKDTE